MKHCYSQQCCPEEESDESIFQRKADQRGLGQPGADGEKNSRSQKQELGARKMGKN